MTDKELIVLAALAIGVDMEAGQEILVFNDVYPERQRRWDPLGDDGDALRLAVKLSFNVYHAAASVFVEDLDVDVEVYEGYEGDKLAATRRAIVRAAAEIGKQLKENHDA